MVTIVVKKNGCSGVGARYSALFLLLKLLLKPKKFFLKSSFLMVHDL
jgi:hypothetical protein